MGQIGEQSRHLDGGFEVAFALAGQGAPGGVEIGVATNAGEDVEERLVSPLGVAHAVGGQEGQTQSSGQCRERLVALLLVTLAMALQLDVESAFEDAVQTVEGLSSGLDPAMREGVSDGAFVAAGQTVQSLGVLLEHRPGHRRFALGSIASRGGEQATEVAVSPTTADQQAESCLGDERGVRRKREGATRCAGVGLW